MNNNNRLSTMKTQGLLSIGIIETRILLGELSSTKIKRQKNKYNQTLYFFIVMKSKLQASIAELYKLKNQIRVQLNQIRPKQIPKYSQNKQKSAKRLFAVKFNDPTNIANPPFQKSKSPKKVSKRLYDRENLSFTETSRVIEKKHFQRHYADNVTLQNNLRHTTCSYFHVQPQKEKSSDLKHNTSLTGIGMHERSGNSHTKSGKRIFNDKLHYDRNFF